jgi:Universal stress protein family
VNEDVDEPGAEGVRAPGGRKRPRVVVGIDGSPVSREALVHALIAAARRGADLDVVSSYSIELYYVGGAPLDVPDVAAIRDDQRERARAVIDEIRAEIPVSAYPASGTSASRCSFPRALPRSRCSSAPRVPSCSWSEAGVGARCAAPSWGPSRCTA